MKAYVKIKKHVLPIKLDDLVREIWGIHRKSFFVNTFGDADDLNTDLYLTFGLDYSEFNDQWQAVPNQWMACFMNISPLANDDDVIVIYTEYIKELPINQKPFYNFVSYVAERLDGVISEDNQAPWMTSLEFSQTHTKMMHANFDSLISKSIELSQVMTSVREPDIANLKWE